jgi:porphobilinogen synthase
LRDLVADIQLHPSDFISPYFIIPGHGEQRSIPSMPGVFQWSLDLLLQTVAADLQNGIKAVMLFGVPEAFQKCPEGRRAAEQNGLIQQATATLKQTFGDDLVVMTDTCLCEYTDHGHCGVIEGEKILNDASIERLAEIALSQARAGADIICPSDMMDGRIGVIRETLDQAGYTDVAMMAYAIKHASRFYGPFRDAAGSAPQFGDRCSYQMDNRRDARESLMEAAQDEVEGADILMIKPAMANLDLLHQVRQQSQLPLAAYHVSGEYAMVKAAAERGWIDEDAVLLETMTSIKRAGASMIVTYAAPYVARWLATH